MKEFLAVCREGHRSYLVLEGFIDPDLDRGRCSTCGRPAQLTRLEPVA